MYSKILVLILCTIFLQLSLVESSSTGCHYSCQSCTEPYHQYCKTCQAGKNILVVNSYPTSKTQVGNSNGTGICSNFLPLSKPNIFGIILILSALILIPFTQNKLVFYLLLTFQTFGLLSFLEIGWLEPLSYILNSFQYFMIVNVITTNIKINNNKLDTYSYYYLQDYFIQPQIFTSMILLGIINIIVILLLAGVIIISNIKDYPFMQKYKNHTICSRNFIHKSINVLCCIFFLLIQQTILSIFVSLQFQNPTPSAATIVILLFYVIFIIFFISVITKHTIIFFPNRLSQIYCLTKKLIFPILVIIQFHNQYLLIILMLCFFILQNFWNYKMGIFYSYKKNIINVLQICIICTSFILFWVDFFADQDIGPLVLNYILTGLICLLLIGFYYQIITTIVQKVNSKKVTQLANILPQQSILHRNKSSKSTSQKRNNTDQSKDQSNQSKIICQIIQPQQKQQNKKDQTMQSFQVNSPQSKIKKQSKRKKIKYDHQEKLKQIRKIYGIS